MNPESVLPMSHQVPPEYKPKASPIEPVWQKSNWVKGSWRVAEHILLNQSHEQNNSRAQDEPFEALYLLCTFDSIDNSD